MAVARRSLFPPWPESIAAAATARRDCPGQARPSLAGAREPAAVLPNPDAGASAPEYTRTLRGSGSRRHRTSARRGIRSIAEQEPQDRRRPGGRETLSLPPGPLLRGDR